MPADAARRSPGRLEAILRSGAFAVTAETTPPESADPEAVIARVAPLCGLADAVNVTDNPTARPRMSALAAAALLARAGIEPVLQLTLRDRNRLALQSDLLGAAALGVPNVLCLHGDLVEAGDQPDAMPVFDLTTLEMLRAARAMRDDGVLLSGRPLAVPPRLFLGCADTPRAPKPGWRPDGLAAKLDAGADFVQTQYCFDTGLVRRYLARLRGHGLTGRAFLLVGIGPLASARAARWMNENLPGAHIPDGVIRRLEGAADPRAEGVRICAELIQELREVDGVAGAHLMAPRQEEAMARAIEESGVLASRRAA